MGNHDAQLCLLPVAAVAAAAAAAAIAPFHSRPESFTFALGVDTRNGEVGSGKYCGTTNSNIIADWYGVADACLADSTCVAFGYRHTWSGGLVGRKCTQAQFDAPMDAADWGIYERSV